MTVLRDPAVAVEEHLRFYPPQIVSGVGKEGYPMINYVISQPIDCGDEAFFRQSRPDIDVKIADLGVSKCLFLSSFPFLIFFFHCSFAFFHSHVDILVSPCRLLG